MQIHQLNILAVGLNAEIMQVVHRLLNAHEQWNGAIACSVEDAIDAIGTTQYHILLLCAGISEAMASQLKTHLAAASPATIMIRHFGGGSGLLENEIRSALDQHGYHLKSLS